MGVNVPAPMFGPGPLSSAALDVLADGIQAAWDTFVPVWSSTGTNPTLGNGVLTGRWIQYGKTAAGFVISLTIGSTTVAGTGNYLFSMPATMRNTPRLPVGMVTLYDDSVGATNMGFAVFNAGTTIALRQAASNVIVSATSPWAPAVNDLIVIAGSCELA